MATSESLSRDVRGVVSLPGLGALVFLIGILWYEIGIGQAVTEREQLQDAADASAFIAATYHARGMNLIVYLNLIMACIMAVIVLLNVLALLLIAIAGIATAIGAGIIAATLGIGTAAAAPFFAIAGLCVDLCGVIKDTVLPELDPLVRGALIGLNDVQVATAVGMPWAAFGVSCATASRYEPSASGTIAISTSQIPDLTWEPPVATAGDAFAPPESSDPEIEAALNERKLGLPVQEGDFNVLCANAAGQLMNLLAWAFPPHNDNASTIPGFSWFAGIFQNMAGLLPQAFCDQNSIDSQKQAQDQIKSNVAQVCGTKQSEWNKCSDAMNAFKFGSPPTPVLANAVPRSCPDGMQTTITKTWIANGNTSARYPSYDYSGCEESETKKQSEEFNGSHNNSFSLTKPKETIPWAANGNDYMAIWSFAWGTYAASPTRGAAYADWSNNGNLGPTDGDRMTMVAKAEFYYDVTEVSQPMNLDQSLDKVYQHMFAGSPQYLHPMWGMYAEASMWNPRWRARLRHVAPPMVGIGTGITTALKGRVESYIGSHLGEHTAVGSSSSDVVGSFLQMPGGLLDGLIAGAIQKQFVQDTGIRH